MAMRVPLEPKAPEAVKDYGIDWRKWVATGVTLVTSIWEVPIGITNDTDSISGLYTLIRLSGGTAGETYTLINKVTSSVGELEPRAIEVRVMTPADILDL